MDWKWDLRIPSLDNSNNTLKPIQDHRHFPKDILKCIFLNENVWISLKISLQFVRINNTRALAEIMAWCRPGHKSLSGRPIASLLTHTCDTWPHWVNHYHYWYCFECFPLTNPLILQIFSSTRAIMIHFLSQQSPSFLLKFWWCQLSLKSPLNPFMWVGTSLRWFGIEVFILKSWTK